MCYVQRNGQREREMMVFLMGMGEGRREKGKNAKRDQENFPPFFCFLFLKRNDQVKKLGRGKKKKKGGFG